MLGQWTYNQAWIEVILGSWGLLFMFNLDDLTGIAGQVLGSNDLEFQRSLCWTYVFWLKTV